MVRVVPGFIQRKTISPIESISGIVGSEVEVPMSELEKNIYEIIRDEDGEYAVVVRTLDEKTLVHLNEDALFWSASLYKLWVMATLYQQVEGGKLEIDTELSGDIVELNEKLDIASESAELSEGEVSGTVEDLLYEMITISGNYPAYLLGDTIGMSNVASLMREYGWNDSHLGSPPETTAQEIADFFEKLYQGELVSEDASEEMLKLLKQQRFNDRIPAGVPENTVVAHKTGELDGYKHDAGIVYSPFGDYIIVILSNTENQGRAVELEAEISKAVWEYLEGAQNVDVKGQN